MSSATRLGAGRAGRKRPPPLLVFTDPRRTPDVEALAGRTPRGAALVYRAFGDPQAAMVARRLAVLCRRRGVKLLIGADDALARACGADGVHLPERLAHRARRLKRGRPGWLVTAAAHGEAAVSRAWRFGADAAVLSTVFESASPSAGPPMGSVRFAARVRRARLPVYALGGVDPKTIRGLKRSGAVGVAAVGAADG